MKKIILLFTLFIATIQVNGQYTRFRLNQLQKDTTAGSILISSPTDSGVIFGRDLNISFTDSSLILFGDTVLTNNSIVGGYWTKTDSNIYYKEGSVSIGDSLFYGAFNVEGNIGSNQGVGNIIFNYGGPKDYPTTLYDFDYNTVIGSYNIINMGRQSTSNADKMYNTTIVGVQNADSLIYSNQTTIVGVYNLSVVDSSFNSTVIGNNSVLNTGYANSITSVGTANLGNYLRSNEPKNSFNYATAVGDGNLGSNKINYSVSVGSLNLTTGIDSLTENAISVGLFNFKDYQPGDDGGVIITAIKDSITNSISIGNRNFLGTQIVDGQIGIGFNLGLENDKTNPILIGNNISALVDNEVVLGNRSDVDQLTSGNYQFNVDQDTTGLDNYVLSFNSPTGQIELVESIPVFTDNTITGNGLSGTPLGVDTSIISTKRYVDSVATTLGGGAMFQQIFIADGTTNQFTVTENSGNLPATDKDLLVAENGQILDKDLITLDQGNSLVILDSIPEAGSRIAVIWFDAIAINGGLDSVFTDNTITGNGLTGSPLRVDTSIIATQGDLSDYVTVAGTQTITGAKTFSTDVDIDGKLDLNDGLSSVFIGTGVGRLDDETDNRNVGVGYQALYSNTSGYENTANGYQALRFNTSGNNNTANGYKTLYSNTSGYRNIASGHQTLYSNTTGYHNTANGNSALYYNTTGYRNTANGSFALFTNTSGYQNTANGYQAGRYTSTGANNTDSDNSVFIGYDSRPLADAQINQIVIGSEARGLGSNTVVIGDTNIVTTRLQGDVGIGTDSPSAKLEVVGNTELNGALTQSGGDVNFDSGTLYVDESENRVGIGTSSPTKTLDVVGQGQISGDTYPLWLINRTNRTTNDLWGTAVYRATKTSSLSDGFGVGFYFEVADPTNNFLIGNIGFVRDGSNNSGAFQVQNSQNGSFGTTFYIKPNGDVGIGTTTPNEKLDVRGRIEIAEQTDPSTAGSGLGTIYANSSNSKLYYRDDSGNNYDLTSTATTSDGSWTNSGAVTYLTDSGDKVGIGTSSPQGVLSVSKQFANAFDLGLTVSDPRYTGIFQFKTNSSTFFLPTLEGYTGTSSVSNGNPLPLGIAIIGAIDTSQDVTNSTQALVSIQGREYDDFPNISEPVVENADIFQVTNWTNVLLKIKANGNVGIGTNSPATKLHVDGTIRYTNRPAAGTITAIGFDTNGDLKASSSSQRYKYNIRPYNKGLDIVNQLNPVYFSYNGESRDNVGFIAEDFDNLGLSELTLYQNETIPEGILYSNITALLTKAIQEQQNIIESQATEIEQLKSQIQLILSEIEQIKNN